MWQWLNQWPFNKKAAVIPNEKVHTGWKWLLGKPLMSSLSWFYDSFIWSLSDLHVILPIQEEIVKHSRILNVHTSCIFHFSLFCVWSQPVIKIYLSTYGFLINELKQKSHCFIRILLHLHFKFFLGVKKYMSPDITNKGIGGKGVSAWPEQEAHAVWLRSEKLREPGSYNPSWARTLTRCSPSLLYRHFPSQLNCKTRKPWSGGRCILIVTSLIKCHSFYSVGRQNGCLHHMFILNFKCHWCTMYFALKWG